MRGLYIILFSKTHLDSPSNRIAIPLEFFRIYKMLHKKNCITIKNAAAAKAQRVINARCKKGALIFFIYADHQVECVCGECEKVAAV